LLNDSSALAHQLVLIVSHSVMEHDHHVNVAARWPEPIHAAAGGTHRDFTIQQMQICFLSLIVESRFYSLNDKVTRFQFFLSHQLLLVDLLHDRLSSSKSAHTLWWIVAVQPKGHVHTSNLLVSFDLVHQDFVLDALQVVRTCRLLRLLLLRSFTIICQRGKIFHITKILVAVCFVRLIGKEHFLLRPTVEALIRTVAVRVVVAAGNKIDSFIATAVVEHDCGHQMFLILRRHQRLRVSLDFGHVLDLFSLDLHNTLGACLVTVSDCHLSVLIGYLLLLLVVALFVQKTIGFFQEHVCVLARQNVFFAELLDQLLIVAGFFDCALFAELRVKKVKNLWLKLLWWWCLLLTPVCKPLVNLLSNACVLVFLLLLTQERLHK
jgi:hypothetical protein